MHYEQCALTRYQELGKECLLDVKVLDGNGKDVIENGKPVYVKNPKRDCVYWISYKKSMPDKTMPTVKCNTCGLEQVIPMKMN